MIRYLTLVELLNLYERVMAQSGGAVGVRDRGAVESALAQPRMTFDGKELYPPLSAKAAALGHALVCNHPFVDGNKRIGHAAMETMLVLNGFELDALVDSQERIILELAQGRVSRNELADWLELVMVPLGE